MSVFVISEIGVSHNGSLREAEQLIVASKRAGANACKFQCFDADKLGRPEIKHLQLSRDDLFGLKQYAERQGIEFCCTPFDVDSLNWLVDIGVKRLKIASGCIWNGDILAAAAVSGLPIILSTGMADAGEIDEAYSYFTECDITLLHCTSAYPCPPQDANLLAMLGLTAPYGYSDHTDGITAALAATALGATVIEKHITLNRLAEGPDHLASVQPQTFKAMVQGIREIEVMLGNGVKRAMPSEAECMKVWR